MFQGYLVVEEKGHIFISKFLYYGSVRYSGIVIARKQHIVKLASATHQPQAYLKVSHVINIWGFCVLGLLYALKVDLLRSVKIQLRRNQGCYNGMVAKHNGSTKSEAVRSPGSV